MKEISLRDLFFVIRNNLYSLILLIIIITFSAYLYVINISNIYRSEAIITIVDDNQSAGMSSIASQFGGIAGMAGIQIPTADSSRKSPAYINAIVKSKKFFKHLVTFDGVLEGVFASSGYDLNKNKLVYDESIFDSSLNKWVRTPKGQLHVIPSYLEAHPVFLTNLFTDVDKKTGFIFISYDHHSPEFAQFMIELIYTELNNLSRSLEYSESQNAITFYQEITNTTQVTNIRNSINRLLEMELQKSMLASTKTNYLVEYIDDPVVPIKKIFPKRSLLMTLIVFFGFIVSLFFILLKHFVFSLPKRS
jgi:hypothetical protein